MWAYFKIECRKFFTNRKNIAIFVLLTCFAIFYAIRLAPAYDPIEKVNYSEMEANYANRDEFLKKREGMDNERAHPAVRYALSIFGPWNELDQARMDALDRGDLKEYARVTSDWYIFTDMQTYRGGYYYYNPRYYTYGNSEAHEEGHLAYLATASRYAAYAELDSNVTLEVLEEFTAIQTIYRLMDDYLPYVLLVSCLLLTVDIVLQDRKYPTLLRGYPLADWKKIFVKACTALVGSIALIVPIFIGYVIMGVQFGFGTLSLPVPVKAGDVFETITMFTYFAKTGLILLTWFAVIITFVIFLSLVVRSEVVNVFAGLTLIFAEFMYMDRGLGFFKPVENYLPTYTEVSKVVTNMKNYFYESSNIDFSRGLLLLASCALVFMLCSIGITLSKRYRLIK